MSIKLMKRGGFRVDVQFKGQRIRETVYGDEYQAKIREAEIRKALLEGVSAPSASIKSITMRELFERTVESRWATCKCDSGIRRAKLVLTEFIGWETVAADVNAALIARMSTHYRVKGNSEATINRKKCAISTMLRVGREQELIEHKPHMGLVKEELTRIRWVTEKEERRLLRHAAEEGDEFVRLLEFLIDTGSRLGEALRVESHDIHQQRVTFWTTKNGKPRTVPLSLRVRDMLPDVGYLFPEFSNRDTRHLYGKLERTLKRAGISDDISFHTMRHTCATRLVSSGVDIRVIKEWLGHSSINTTMRYAHLSPDLLDKALHKLENTAH